MAKFMKVTIQMSIYIMVTFLLLEICIATLDTEKHTGSSEDTKHRSRRQTGDIFLLGLKAKTALKGTTRPSDYFARIGKKRSMSMSAPSSYGRLRDRFQPFEYDDEIFTL